MKSVFAGVSAVALAVAGAAGIASALGNEQTNKPPTKRSSQSTAANR